MPSTTVGPLGAGSCAPAFVLPWRPQRSVALDDYRGRPLVIAFYVADWHPVCTAQLERLRDTYAEIQRAGADLVAISTDSVWSHTAFANATRLPFPLLADDQPHGRAAYSYGVYDPSKRATQRALFVVGDSGEITWSAVFPDALDPGVDPILTALESLGSTTAADDQRQGVDR